MLHEVTWLARNIGERQAGEKEKIESHESSDIANQLLFATG